MLIGGYFGQIGGSSPRMDSEQQAIAMLERLLRIQAPPAASEGEAARGTATATATSTGQTTGGATPSPGGAAPGSEGTPPSDRGVAEALARPQFCSNCGTRLAADVRFCTQCGTPVR